MPYRQIVWPNNTASGRIGYCEAYIEAFFNVTLREPSARAAWDAAKFKHPGEDPPPGVIVPMYWDYYNPENNNNNDGHVAGSLGDGRIKSSPWQPGTTYAILNSRAELENIYSNNGLHPLKYLGWSEDISNVKVVEGAKMSDVFLDAEEVDLAFKIGFNRPATQGELDTYANKVYAHDVLSTIFENNLDFRAKASQYDELQAKYEALVNSQPAPDPLPNLSPLPFPGPLEPEDQKKVNIFVALWKAIFG